MALYHTSNIDARGVTINNIGRDQTYNNTTVYQPTIQINIWLFCLRLPLTISDTISRPVSVPGTSSPQNPPVTMCCSFDTVSVLNIARNIIIQITDRLINHRDSSNNHPKLHSQFTSLHQTLTLTGLAIEAYSDRPLGQSLADTIAVEAEQSFALLLEFLEKIDDTSVGLNSTRIWYLWRPVWWSRWDGGEFASLGRKLLGVQQSLDEILVALNSYVLLSFHIWPAADNVIVLYTKQI